MKNTQLDDFIKSFSIKKVLWRYAVSFMLIILFNIKGLLNVINYNVANNISWYSFSAIMKYLSVYSDAVISALGWLYPTINSIFGNTISQISIGQIIFSILVFGLLIFQYYGIIGILTSWFMPESNNTTITLISLVTTIAVLILGSILIHSMGIVPTELISSANTTINSTITNMSNSTGGVPVINLI